MVRGNTNFRNFTVGATPIQIWSGAENRSAAVLCSPAGGRVTFSPSNAVADGQGVLMQTGDPNTILSRDLHH